MMTGGMLLPELLTIVHMYLLDKVESTSCISRDVHRSPTNPFTCNSNRGLISEVLTMANTATNVLIERKAAA